MKPTLATSIFVVSFAFTTNPVGADIITSPNQLNSGRTVITFEDVPVGTPLPLSISGATITSNLNPTVQAPGFTQYPGIFEGRFLFQFGAVPNYFIEFDSPVAEFGMGIFDPNFSGNIFRALDVFGNEIVTVSSAPGDPFFPVGSVNGVFSTFLGLVRPTDEIKRIELIAAPGDLLGIDNVSFYRVVPEPSAFMLQSVTLLGLLTHRRRVPK